MIPRYLQFLAFSLLASLVLVPASTAQDLNGKWRIDNLASVDEFVDVVDVAGAVSMTLVVEGFSLPFTGTLVGSMLSLTSTDPLCLGTCSINVTTIAGNDYFDGQLLIQSTVARMLVSRCECFDGNAVEGDGCDTKCRIEPCFTCAGTPSTCTPTPDGGSCSDASACTSGETCTAGVCNGNPVTPCVDLSGTWDSTLTTPGFGSFDFVWQVEQRENVVLFRNPSTGKPGTFGLIDPATGDFDLAAPFDSPVCLGISETRIGTAAPDGQTYTASGIFLNPTPLVCSGFSYTETGSRQLPIQASGLSRFGGIALALTLMFVTAWTVRRVYV